MDLWLLLRQLASVALVGAALSLAPCTRVALMGTWGGHRHGAGAKPKPRPLKFITKPESPAEPVEAPPEEEKEDDGDLSRPPTDLPPEGQSFWRAYAPLAIERQTLTVSTVPSFTLLCELHAKKVLVGSMVDKGALGGLRVFMQLAKQVESLMARFCLAPFGKPAAGEKPKGAVNPWAKFSQS